MLIIMKYNELSENKFLYNYIKSYVTCKRYLENYKNIIVMITAIKLNRFKIVKKSEIRSFHSKIEKQQTSKMIFFIISRYFLWSRIRLNTERREIIKQWAEFMLSSRLKRTINRIMKGSDKGEKTVIDCAEAYDFADLFP